MIGSDPMNGLARGNLVQIFIFKRVFEVFALPLCSRDRTPAGFKGLGLCQKPRSKAFIRKKPGANS